MSNSRIKITGVSTKIPQVLYSLPHKQITQTQKLMLSKNREEMKKIISADIKIEIKTCEKNLKVFPRKIIIKAIKKIKIVYESINNDIHTAKYSIPFEVPIILNKDNFKIDEVINTATEVSIKMINTRAVYLTSSVIIALLIERVSKSYDINKNINIEKCKKQNRCKYNKNKNYYNTKFNKCDKYNYYNPINVILCLILILVILNRFKFITF